MVEIRIEYGSTREEFENKINKVGIENITDLDLNFNKNITELPNFPNLRILNCSFTYIKTIPFMEKLEELICFSCPGLSKIPHFPNLKKLGISDTNFSFIPIFEKLELLVCNICPKLFEIPYLPNLRELWLYSTVDFVKVSYLPNLKKLYCYHNLKIKFYNKDLIINDKIDTTIQHFQGMLYQNTYRTYELLIF